LLLIFDFFVFNTVEENEYISKIIPLQDKLYRFARRLLKNEEDAKDAVQEVIIKLWEKCSMIDSERNIEAFAMSVTKNYCIDKLRTRHIQLVPIKGIFPTQKSLNPDIMLEQKEELEIVEQIIATLPAKQRAILQLRDVEGMEMSEIAKIMKMKPNNVKVNLSRARKKVKEKLEAYENGYKNY